MALDPALLELMATTVAVHRRNGTDDFGNDVFTLTEAALPARVTLTLIKGGQGDRKDETDDRAVYQADIWTPPLVLFPADKIVYVKGSTTYELFVDSFKLWSDENMEDHHMTIEASGGVKADDIPSIP